jgi:hypothetical protein
MRISDNYNSRCGNVESLLYHGTDLKLNSILNGRFLLVPKNIQGGAMKELKTVQIMNEMKYKLKYLSLKSLINGL